MSVRNEEMKTFREMSEEEQLELISDIQKGKAEFYNADTNDWDKAVPHLIGFAIIYRTKQRQLNIPWMFIKPEYKWAAMDVWGKIAISTTKIKIDEKHGCFRFNDGDVYVFANELDINTTDISWKESLTQRPEEG